jgi:CBS domain-containing protein
MISSFVVHKASWMRLCVLGGIAVALASFLGWQAGETTVSAGPPLAPAKWALPTVVPEDPAKDVAALTSRHPWSTQFGVPDVANGGANGSAAAPGTPAPVPWRLAGIVERPDGVFALIANGQPGAIKFEYRGVGDKLPDGSTLVKITSDSAVTEAGSSPSEQRVYWLFRRKS